MSQAGEFRLCSGCGQWALWTPRLRKGPVFCCETCARGLRCACAQPLDEPSPLPRRRGPLGPGGYHAHHEPVPARPPRA